MTPWTPPTRPDLAGGTPAPGPETYAHPLLAAEGQALAEGAVRMFEARFPEAMARYGERGRRHTLEDNYWHLTTLDAAFRLQSPALLTEYVQWLRAVLGSRGVPDALVRVNFVYLRERLADLGAEPGLLDYLDRAIALIPEA